MFDAAIFDDAIFDTGGTVVVIPDGSTAVVTVPAMPSAEVE